MFLASLERETEGDYYYDDFEEETSLELKQVTTTTGLCLRSSMSVREGELLQLDAYRERDADNDNRTGIQ